MWQDMVCLFFTATCVARSLVRATHTTNQKRKRESKCGGSGRDWKPQQMPTTVVNHRRCYSYSSAESASPSSIVPFLRKDGHPPAYPATAPHELLQVHVYFRHGIGHPHRVGRPKPRPSYGRAACKTGNTSHRSSPGGFSLPSGRSRQGICCLRTTNSLRTNLTAWFLLQALLESSEAVTAIPFTCGEEEDENLYHNEHCPRLRLKWEQAWAAVKKGVGDDGVNWREHFKDMQAATARELEIALDDPGFLLSMDGAGFPWITAVDTYECGRFRGDALPEGVTGEDVAAVRSLLSPDYAASFRDRDVLQLSRGRLVRELKEALLDRVNNAPQSSPRRSLYLYSGHDAAIMPLPVAMGVSWTEWPGYTSSIGVELWRSQDGEHFVRLLFDRKEVAVPVSGAEGAPKKVLLSFDEFCEVAEWSGLSETNFSSRSEDVSDIVPTVPNRTLAYLMLSTFLE